MFRKGKRSIGLDRAHSARNPWNLKCFVFSPAQSVRCNSKAAQRKSRSECWCQSSDHKVHYSVFKTRLISVMKTENSKYVFLCFQSWSGLVHCETCINMKHIETSNNFRFSQKIIRFAYINQQTNLCKFEPCCKTAFGQQAGTTWHAWMLWLIQLCLSYLSCLPCLCALPSVDENNQNSVENCKQLNGAAWYVFEWVETTRMWLKMRNLQLDCFFWWTADSRLMPGATATFDGGAGCCSLLLVIFTR